MIPVDQTILHVPGVSNGNCLAACLASLLEVDIATVPNFVDDKKYWERNMQKWLFDNHGLRNICMPYNDSIGAHIFSVDFHYMMVGQSPRGKFNHMVIGKNGKMVHDPHPDKTGILEFKYIEFLVKV